MQKAKLAELVNTFSNNLKARFYHRGLSSVGQWRETSAVINWFKTIKNEKNCIFMRFDIEEFHPSISKELLLKAITYAKILVNISDEEIKTIMHSRKFLLFKGIVRSFH